MAEHYVTVRVNLARTQFMRDHDTAFMNYVHLFKATDDIADKYGWTQCGGGHNLETDEMESLYKSLSIREIEAMKNEMKQILQKLIVRRMIRSYMIFDGIGEFSVEYVMPIMSI